MRYSAYRIYRLSFFSRNVFLPLASAYRKRMDTIAMVAAFLMPMTAIPQIVHIFHVKSADGISLLTWVLFFLFSLPMLAYGAARGDRVLIVLNCLWLVMYSIIIVQILVY